MLSLHFLFSTITLLDLLTALTIGAREPCSDNHRFRGGPRGLAKDGGPVALTGVWASS